jgi:hypothetical protein
MINCLCTPFFNFVWYVSCTSVVTKVR